jgi:hypothetical protein
MIYYNMYFSRNSIFQCETYISSYTNKPWRQCLFKFIQCEELFNIICFRRKLFLVTQMVVQTLLFRIVLLIITCQISCTQRFFFHYIIQPNTFLKAMWKYCKHIVCQHWFFIKSIYEASYFVLFVMLRFSKQQCFMPCSWCLSEALNE